MERKALGKANTKFSLMVLWGRSGGMGKGMNPQQTQKLANGFISVYCYSLWKVWYIFYMYQTPKTRWIRANMEYGHIIERIILYFLYSSQVTKNGLSG